MCHESRFKEVCRRYVIKKEGRKEGEEEKEKERKKDFQGKSLTHAGSIFIRMA